MRREGEDAGSYVGRLGEGVRFAFVPESIVNVMDGPLVHPPRVYTPLEEHSLRLLEPPDVAEHHGYMVVNRFRSFYRLGDNETLIVPQGDRDESAVLDAPLVPAIEAGKKGVSHGGHETV